MDSHRHDADDVDAGLPRGGRSAEAASPVQPFVSLAGAWRLARGAYRNQPLGGPHDAVADARLLLQRLEQMGATVPAARW